MKLTHCIYKGLASLLTAAMGLACQSCSEDISGGGEDILTQPKGHFTLTIAAKDVATRGTTFTGDAADNELIHTCVVAFVKEDDGTVVEVLQLPENTSGVDKQEFTVELGAGSYLAYAFANIDTSTLTGLHFTKGENFGDVDTEKFDVASYLTSSSRIPMSGLLEDIEVESDGTVKVGEDEMDDVVIPVIRMVGKLEFQFTNDSSSDITVTGITFKPTATGAVNLLPSASISTGTTDPYGVSKEPDLTINAKGGEKTIDNFAFYVREVKSDHPTGHFPIRIKYKVGNSTEEDEMTALLYELTEIHRNDWIRVPITLTDYKLKLDVEFYPPIGGFPPVDWEENDDEYYVTFATGGWFSIDVSVLDKDTGVAVDADNVSIRISSVEDKSEETTVPFFRKEPSIDTLTGELTGEINSRLTSGDTAIVTIVVTVTENSVETKFTRKIHFIYK